VSSHLIRSDLVPIVTGYALVMLILAAGLVVQRRRAAAGLAQGRAAAAGRRDHGWLALAAHVAADVIGGYMLLGAVVVAYYYGVAKVGSNFLASAFTGSALLLAVSLPVFAAASLLTWRRAQRQARRRGQPPPPAPPPPAPPPPTPPSPAPPAGGAADRP
jgi:hypothetical protein